MQVAAGPELLGLAKSCIICGARDKVTHCHNPSVLADLKQTAQKCGMFLHSSYLCGKHRMASLEEMEQGMEQLLASFAPALEPTEAKVDVCTVCGDQRKRYVGGSHYYLPATAHAMAMKVGLPLTSTVLCKTCNKLWSCKDNPTSWKNFIGNWKTYKNTILDCTSNKAGDESRKLPDPWSTESLTEKMTKEYQQLTEVFPQFGWPVSQHTAYLRQNGRPPDETWYQDMRKIVQMCPSSASLLGIKIRESEEEEEDISVCKVACAIMQWNAHRNPKRFAFHRSWITLGLRAQHVSISVIDYLAQMSKLVMSHNSVDAFLTEVRNSTDAIPEQLLSKYRDGRSCLTLAMDNHETYSKVTVATSAAGNELQSHTMITAVETSVHQGGTNNCLIELLLVPCLGAELRGYSFFDQEVWPTFLGYSTVKSTFFPPLTIGSVAASVQNMHHDIEAHVLQGSGLTLQSVLEYSLLGVMQTSNLGACPAKTEWWSDRRIEMHSMRLRFLEELFPSLKNAPAFNSPVSFLHGCVSASSSDIEDAIIRVFEVLQCSQIDPAEVPRIRLVVDQLIWKRIYSKLSQFSPVLPQDTLTPEEGPLTLEQDRKHRFVTVAVPRLRSLRLLPAVWHYDVHLLNSVNVLFYPLMAMNAKLLGRDASKLLKSEQKYENNLDLFKTVWNGLWVSFIVHVVQYDPRFGSYFQQGKLRVTRDTFSNFAIDLADAFCPPGGVESGSDVQSDMLLKLLFLYGPLILGRYKAQRMGDALFLESTFGLLGPLFLAACKPNYVSMLFHHLLDLCYRDKTDIVLDLSAATVSVSGRAGHRMVHDRNMEDLNRELSEALKTVQTKRRLIHHSYKKVVGLLPYKRRFRYLFKKSSRGKVQHDRTRKSDVLRVAGWTENEFLWLSIANGVHEPGVDKTAGLEIPSQFCSDAVYPRTEQSLWSDFAACISAASLPNTDMNSREPVDLSELSGQLAWWMQRLSLGSSAEMDDKWKSYVHNFGYSSETKQGLQNYFSVVLKKKEATSRPPPYWDGQETMLMDRTRTILVSRLGGEQYDNCIMQAWDCAVTGQSCDATAKVLVLRRFHESLGKWRNPKKDKKSDDVYPRWPFRNKSSSAHNIADRFDEIMHEVHFRALASCLTEAEHNKFVEDAAVVCLFTMLRQFLTNPQSKKHTAHWTYLFPSEYPETQHELASKSPATDDNNQAGPGGVSDADETGTSAESGSDPGSAEDSDSGNEARSERDREQSLRRMYSESDSAMSDWPDSDSSTSSSSSASSSVRSPPSKRPKL